MRQPPGSACCAGTSAESALRDHPIASSLELPSPTHTVGRGSVTGCPAHRWVERRHQCSAALPSGESGLALLLECCHAFDVVFEVSPLGGRRSLLPVGAVRVLIPAPIDGGF